MRFMGHCSMEAIAGLDDIGACLGALWQWCVCLGGYQVSFRASNIHDLGP